MKSRKRRCISKPLHVLFCVLAMVLILILVRLFCGPPKLMTERTALCLAQRRALREPDAPALQLDFQNWQVFAVWDGEAVQTYYTLWTRPGRRSYSQNDDGERGFRLMRDPLLKEYEWCQFWRDSREFGWGCPGYKLSGYVAEDGRWEIREYVPLAVINGDPDVASGVLTVSGSCTRDGETGEYAWTAAAVREDPRVFLFQLTPGEDLTNDFASWVLSDISMGEELFSAASAKEGVNEPGVTALAEVVWYDEKGNELYRQEFDLLRRENAAEGSEEHGA